MASRRFFYDDPYDYYYTSPYHYAYPYHRYQHPAPSRGVGGFFPAVAEAAPEAVKVDPRPRVESSRSVSVPVRFVGSDPEPVRGAARMPQAAVLRKRAPSSEAAAIRLQAAARGFMARKSVRAVREVEREAAEVGEKVAREAEALRGDARARIAVGETLMKMLLRLDAVRGAREYRKRVTKRVLALQDAVDALEPKPAPDSEVVAEENESEVTSEMADDSAEATEMPVAAEHSGGIEVNAAAETVADMEVDGGKADSEAVPEAVKESENKQDDGHINDDQTEVSDEGGWEMVADEADPTTAVTGSTEAPPQAPMTSEVTRPTGEAGAADSALDTRKVMEMVAALCEQNAQQCAVIGALAERVDALERAVRRVEDAERRRRRGKKLKKDGKGSNRCYTD